MTDDEYPTDVTIEFLKIDDVIEVYIRRFNKTDENGLVCEQLHTTDLNNMEIVWDIKPELESLPASLTIPLDEHDVINKIEEGLDELCPDRDVMLKDLVAVILEM